MIIIEDEKQTLELLNNIRDYFANIDCTEQRLNKELSNKELERDDLLHEIELSKLNAIERSRIYTKLEKVLKERRIIKDKIALINTVKGYTNKFIIKGICADTDTAIKNIETLQRNNLNRKYTPRILKDLKCAKKGDEEK